MSEKSLFKHDVNRIIEKCAEKLRKEMGFNPLQVLRHFQLFTMHFFANTPQVPNNEIENWYYLRDSSTHSAVIFNYETEELRLVDPEHYWEKTMIEFFKKSEEELEKEQEQYDLEMDRIKRTLVYRKLRPVIKWYFKCPLPFVRTLSPLEFISEVLEKFPDQFDLESKEYEKIAHELFDAYHHDKGVSKRAQDFIVASISEYKDGKEYIGAESFRTPEDVLEYCLKYRDKSIKVDYNIRLKSYQIILK